MDKPPSVGSDVPALCVLYLGKGRLNFALAHTPGFSMVFFRLCVAAVRTVCILVVGMNDMCYHTTCSHVSANVNEFL